MTHETSNGNKGLNIVNSGVGVSKKIVDPYSELLTT